MVSVISRTLFVVVLIPALLLSMGVSDVFATSKLEAVLNQYQSKVGPMETNGTNSEVDEYYQVYEALDGY